MYEIHPHPTYIHFPQLLLIFDGMCIRDEMESYLNSTIYPEVLATRSEYESEAFFSINYEDTVRIVSIEKRTKFFDQKA